MEEPQIPGVAPFIAAKILGEVGESWAEQTEELPVHRSLLVIRPRCGQDGL